MSFPYHGSICEAENVWIWKEKHYGWWHLISNDYFDLCQFHVLCSLVYQNSIAIFARNGNILMDSVQVDLESCLYIYIIFL